jgi:hypothetical protein
MISARPIDLYLYPYKSDCVDTILIQFNESSEFQVGSKLHNMRCSVFALLAWATIATAASRRNAGDKQYTLEAANIKAKVSRLVIHC